MEIARRIQLGRNELESGTSSPFLYVVLFLAHAYKKRTDQRLTDKLITSETVRVSLTQRFYGIAKRIVSTRNRYYGSPTLTVISSAKELFPCT